MVGGDYVGRNFQRARPARQAGEHRLHERWPDEVDFLPVLVKNLTLMATTLRARTDEEKGRIRDALLREVWPLIERGRIRPIVDSRYPLAEADAAHAHMRAGGHSGKILLEMPR